MLDHIGIPVSDMARSKVFFEKALEPLGYRTLADFGAAAGLGTEAGPDFWIAQGEPSATLHVAFSCETRALVDAFYAAAIAAGGKDNGGPGLRPQYTPDYYGAFVLDPDGNNIEAVCHSEE